MSKSRPVVTNLLQQNCFVRDFALGSDLKSSYSDTTYTSIDEKTDDKGLHIEFNNYPYPITPQYVNSFVDSSDYRRDPANAIANGVKRVNLGDVSSIQDLAKLDSSAQRSLYEQLSAKFNKPVDKPVDKSVDKPVDKSVDKPVDHNGGNV